MLTRKRLPAIAAILALALIIACNNNTEESTEPKTDTTAAPAPAPDTTSNQGDTASVRPVKPAN